MKNEFKSYLINKGYNEFTKSGNPSTVYSYLNCVENVLVWEGISWKELAMRISDIYKLYNKGGINEQRGTKAHRKVINALKQYKLFVVNNEFNN